MTGIPGADLIESARLYAGAKAASIIYCMGVTQFSFGTGTVVDLSNLAAITGNFGRPGTGVNPLRGQNNVQGACDMGCLPNSLPGYLSVTADENRKRFEADWGVSLPQKPGLKIPEAADAILDGRLRALYVFGENPIMSDPDSNHLRHALEQLELLIVQDIFLTETARLANVVLPAACWARKTASSAIRSAGYSGCARPSSPPGRPALTGRFLRSSPKGLATSRWITRTRRPSGMRSAGWCRRSLAGSATVASTRSGESVGPARAKTTRERRSSTRTASFPHHLARPASGRYCSHRMACPRPRSASFPQALAGQITERPDEEFPFVLTTGRRVYHYHTGTMTRRSAPLNQVGPGQLVEINPLDAARLGIGDGDPVN